MEYSVRGKRFEFAAVFFDYHTHTAHTEAVTAFIRLSGKRKSVGEIALSYEIVFLLHYYDVALGFDGNVYYPALLFRYFLDGSRKTYKVDDMSYRNQVYPIIAGQVGIGCCLREQGEMLPLRDPAYERQLVISLPKVAKSSDWDDDELSFEYLLKKINGRP